MKYWVDVHEWFPVLEVSKEKNTFSTDSIEITEEQFEYIQKVFNEFDRVQEKLTKLTDRGLK